MAGASNGLKEKVDLLLEGCMPDTVMGLQYIELDLEIPKNAKILKIGSQQFPLYAKTRDFDSIELERSLGSKGGFPLEVFEPMINWGFDNPRSLITRDGRIYLSSAYFKEGFTWYQKFIPTILKDCKERYSRGS